MLSFQKAELIYDLTFRFAHKYLSRGDRTIDQMIQSARSGKKNLLEGSKAALTSKETEIKLTNVARASLEELLDDYLDYLRARNHPIWEKDSREAHYVRRLGRKSPTNYEDYRDFMETRPPAVMANIAICLIHQANYLIDQQLRRLEKDFVEQGGLRERMTRARLTHRNRRPKP
ncbi:MAG TPA: four helix bundle suffix domain-containing protein [Chthoniobacterales bacterium]